MHAPFAFDARRRGRARPASISRRYASVSMRTHRAVSRRMAANSEHSGARGHDFAGRDGANPNSDGAKKGAGTERSTEVEIKLEITPAQRIRLLQSPWFGELAAA